MEGSEEGDEDRDTGGEEGGIRVTTCYCEEEPHGQEELALRTGGGGKQARRKARTSVCGIWDEDWLRQE